MSTDHPKTAGWRDHPRYPDPAIEILDERFRPYTIFSAAVERLYTGCRWSEGPVWFGDGRYLLWSDIPNNRILKWEEETGEVSVYRKPSNYANGHTRDRQGRLITCEHGGRRVSTWPRADGACKRGVLWHRRVRRGRDWEQPAELRSRESSKGRED